MQRTWNKRMKRQPRCVDNQSYRQSILVDTLDQRQG